MNDVLSVMCGKCGVKHSVHRCATGRLVAQEAELATLRDALAKAREEVEEWRSAEAFMSEQAALERAAKAAAERARDEAEERLEATYHNMTLYADERNEERARADAAEKARDEALAEVERYRVSADTLQRERDTNNAHHRELFDRLRAQRDEAVASLRALHDGYMEGPTEAMALIEAIDPLILNARRVLAASTGEAK